MGQDKLPAWKKLSHLAASSKTVFQNIKDRLQKEHTKIKLYTLDGLALDISKNIINEEILFNLQLLTKECLLPEKIKSLFSANKINKTENRAAAHWLLRGVLGNDKKILNWSDKVTDELTKMENIVDKILSGQWRGFNGKAVTDVVNLGVGGSELGPLMVCTALTDFEVKVINPVNIHFASSIDGSQLSILLKKLNPETTLFILASKSFTTIDTFSNAETAKKWMSLYCQDESIIIQQHFIGISAKQNLMDEWGLGRDNQLLFWDWVGGRFSLWSTIGLPIALKIGMKGFRELLKGAHSMDEHFMQADFSDNLPVILAMVGIWNVNFLHIQQHAILPYDGRFIFFPQFLQQLEMESNGKSVANTGEKVQYSTCPVIWGGVGPNSQHAFYQLLHQGTQKVSCDFILAINRYDNIQSKSSRINLKKQQKLSQANCLAQSRVLFLGDDAIESNVTIEKVPEYKKYPGGQPSSTLLIDEITPFSLGQLIALYEHKVFVQSVIWDINPFDQWGVELGKVMAKETWELLDSNINNTIYLDQSTLSLIDHIHQKKQN